MLQIYIAAVQEVPLKAGIHPEELFKAFITTEIGIWPNRSLTPIITVIPIFFVLLGMILQHGYYTSKDDPGTG